MNRVSEASSPTLAYEFGDFILDVERGTLMLSGRDVPLRPKAYSLLLYLVERHGRLISRDELLDSVWKGAVVTDDAVTQCLIEVRRALGDSDHCQIRTVPRRGYVFETPVEEKRDYDRNGHATGTSGRSRPLRLVLIAALGMALLGFAIWHVVGTSGERDSNASAVGQSRHSPSIAVLPFDDLSINQDQRYLADGIADHVLSQLTNVQGLRVIARTSSFSFKDQDVSIDEIATSLDVSHVLQGSVRKSGRRIRVSAQLIDASNSEQIWSETFDRRFDDVFELQDEIAKNVVDRLELSFSEQLPRTRVTNTEAYNLYLQAMFALEQVTPANVEKAETLLRQVIEIDPGNGPAWRELARMRLVRIGWESSASDDVQAVRDALSRAMGLDPNDPATIVYLAGSMADFDGDVEQAARLYERAITLNPSDEHVLRTSLIFLTNFASAEDAIALGEYGTLRNPVCFHCTRNLFFAYMRGHQFEKAEAAARSMLFLHDKGQWHIAEALLLQGRAEESLEWFSQHPYEELRNTGIAMALFSLGRYAESEALMKSFPELNELDLPFSFHILAHSWTGNLDEAFSAFEQVIEFGQTYRGEEVLRKIPWEMVRLARSPFLANMHADPRWESIARRLHITDEQQHALNFKLVLPTDD